MPLFYSDDLLAFTFLSLISFTKASIRQDFRVTIVILCRWKISSPAGALPPCSARMMLGSLVLTEERDKQSTARGRAREGGERGLTNRRGTAAAAAEDAEEEDAKEEEEEEEKASAGQAALMPGRNRSRLTAPRLGKR